MASYTIHACVADPTLSHCAVTGGPKARVNTATGLKLLSAFTPCAKAGLTISGGTVDGDVILAARHGGLSGNDITVELQAGGSLGVVATGADVVVQLGSGTAQQVADAINADLDEEGAGAAALVVATAGGDGSGAPSAQAQTYLSGGLDDGEEAVLGSATVRVATLDVGA